MNHGSRVLLESLDAWPERSADIRSIHVSQRGRLGRSLIRHTDFDVPQLGSVVGYSGLYARLEARVAQCGVTLLSGPPARILEQDADGVRVAQGDTELRCRVVVQSDGAGGEDLRRDYGQHAVLTTAHATLPRPGWAWERFTSEGPLALLPHPHTPEAHSVVWCSTPQRAAELAALDNAAFARAERRLRRPPRPPVQPGAASRFPLALSARRAQVQGRVAAIGNAAQTLHPVAGQGLNLGLRDAARLAQALGAWLPGPDASPAPALAEFAGARQFDRLITAGLTDLMPRVRHRPGAGGTCLRPGAAGPGPGGAATRRWPGICCKDSGPSPAPAATIRPWKGAALCLVRPGLLPSRCRTKRGFDQAG